LSDGSIEGHFYELTGSSYIGVTFGQSPVEPQRKIKNVSEWKQVHFVRPKIKIRTSYEKQLY
jgi:hypothetical protein